MTYKWALVLLLAVAGGTRGDDNQLNGLIDEAIYENAKLLVKNGWDLLHVPDVGKSFEVSFLDNMRVSLNLTDGVFWNISTIARVGDVEEEDKPDGTMVFKLGLGLKDAMANFTLAYRIGFFYGSRKVHLECNDNSVFSTVSLKYTEDGQCDVNFELAQFKSLGAFKVVFDPPGFLDDELSKVLDYVANFLGDNVKKALNLFLTPVLQMWVKQADICSKLPF